MVNFLEKTEVDLEESFEFVSGKLKVREGSGGSLQRVEENGNFGFRLVGFNPDGHGDIGLGAIDLSRQIFPGNKGATGSYSFALGPFSHASGEGAMAIGGGSVASGTASFAMGSNITANSFASTVMGLFATISPNQDALGISVGDDLFKIGNGTAPDQRSDALLIRKDGTFTIGGTVGFSVTYPPTGVGVNNGMLFKGTDGALYYKSDSGSVTQLA